MKLVFLTVLLTIIDVFILPLLVFDGARAVWRASHATKFSPPEGWDTRQFGRRRVQLFAALLMLAVWAAFTLAAVFLPQRLVPLGFFGTLGCVCVPVLPLVVTSIAIDALLPSRYLEGLAWIDLHDEGQRAVVTIGEESFPASPSQVSQLGQGRRAVRALVTGYLKRVVRIEAIDP